MRLAETQSEDGAREGWEGLAQAPHAAGGARLCFPTLQLFGNGGGKRGGKGGKEDLGLWCWSGRDVTRAQTGVTKFMNGKTEDSSV